MKKQDQEQNQSKNIQDQDVQPAKGTRGTKTMRQRQRAKNTDDISMNEGFDVDHNSDPILAKKQ